MALFKRNVQIRCNVMPKCRFSFILNMVSSCHELWTIWKMIWTILSMVSEIMNYFLDVEIKWMIKNILKAKDFFRNQFFKIKNANEFSWEKNVLIVWKEALNHIASSICNLQSVVKWKGEKILIKILNT